MGKIEDMRRQREQQFADAEQREAKAAKAVKPAPAAAPVTKVVAVNAPGGAEQGKCPDCGKAKPLSNGVLANHQKGFGKACSGSRKKPA
jgi:hypothetical protein